MNEMLTYFDDDIDDYQSMSIIYFRRNSSSTSSSRFSTSRATTDRPFYTSWRIRNGEFLTGLDVRWYREFSHKTQYVANNNMNNIDIQSWLTVV